LAVQVVERRKLATSVFCICWRATRIDVVEGTRTLHKVALARILETDLATKRIDEITPDNVTAAVAALVEHTYKRETIKKSITFLAMVLDHHKIDPNPARGVKLPRERKPHVPPPLAEHIEHVAERMPKQHVLPLLIVDRTIALARAQS
jgi:hypothetical protein